MKDIFKIIKIFIKSLYLINPFNHKFKTYKVLALFTICIGMMGFSPLTQINAVVSTSSKTLNGNTFKLGYSTFFGGNGFTYNSYTTPLVVDSKGNSYIVGSTVATNLPIIGNGSPFKGGYMGFVAMHLKNAWNSTYGGSGDGFLTKFDASGNIIYSTYIGGSSSDTPEGIVVDSFGDCYITGQTLSNNFPMRNPYNKTNSGNGDVFLSEFDPSGYLTFSTYLGGSSAENIDSIAIDQYQNIYLTGSTTSSDFPMKNAWNSTYGGNGDIFISKFSSNHSLLLSTFFGGSQGDFSHDIAIDSSGNIYLGGDTYSANLPMKNAYNSTYGGNSDAFITKFNSNGTILFSTYFGSNTIDYGHGLAIDNKGNIYFVGQTASTSLPMKNAYNSTYGGNSDAFFSEFSTTGSLLYSTFLGGNQFDSANEIVVDSWGNAYVYGTTQSPNFPLNQPYRSVLTGSEDVFLTQFLTTTPIALTTSSSSNTVSTISSAGQSSTSSSSTTQDLGVLSNRIVMGIGALLVLSVALNIIMVIRRK